MHHTLFLMFAHDALNTARVTVFDARDASMLVMHHTVCWMLWMHHTLPLMPVFDALNAFRVSVFDARDTSHSVLHACV